MMTKPTPQLPPGAPTAEDTKRKSGADPEPAAESFCNQQAASILLSIFKPAPPGQAPGPGGTPPDEAPLAAKTASVKFMITARDEEELRKLGYTRDQINRLTPQQAEKILEAKAHPNHSG